MDYRAQVVPELEVCSVVWMVKRGKLNVHVKLQWTIERGVETTKLKESIA
jgi:hypothetical protein